MNNGTKNTNGESGFVMIASLLILLVLTVLGVAVNRNTEIEWQIAMNDRVHKETFYNADAATELASEILEQSIACLGFGQNPSGMTLAGANNNNVYIDPSSLGFWRNYAPNGIEFPTEEDPDWGTDVVRPDIIYPVSGAFSPYDSLKKNNADWRPHARIKIGGNTKLTAGAAIQMAAGYEGVGKSLAMNGAVLIYDIKVTEIGERGSISRISVQYGHALGTEGTCNY
ncbi:PilX N-terminal [Candidatus Electronema halotolerans]